MKTYVLYHANCYDGFCAAWVAHNALAGQDVEFIPVNYGQAPPEVARDKNAALFVLDFSYPASVTFELAAFRHQKMVVLDHHKTAQKDLDGIENEVICNGAGDALKVVFDMEKSGGRLTWEYFHGTKTTPGLVDITEDRDLWLYRLPNSREINSWLRSHPLDFEYWNHHWHWDVDDFQCYVDEGAAILRREQQIVDEHVARAREITMDGHKILATNATTLYSEIAGKLADGHPFGACFFINSAGCKQWSLRSTDAGVDVSEIAKAHGGGGHRNAAGFQE